MAATIASVVLGVAFVVAGASKLAAGSSWRSQAGELGSPPWLAPLIPWIELVVGAALVAQLVQPLPAVAAIVMLLAFTIAIAVRLAQGRRPACACFGAWSAKPIGVGHLARNAALLALAVLALAAP